MKVDEIIRCEASNNYTTFFLLSGEKILVCKTLKEFSDLLKTKERPELKHDGIVKAGDSVIEYQIFTPLPREIAFKMSDSVCVLQAADSGFK